jgi:Cytochrome oxidase complex assembly protein 1
MSQNPYDPQKSNNNPPSNGGGSMVKVLLFVLLGVLVLCGGMCGGSFFFIYKAGKGLVEGITVLQGQVQSAAKAMPQVKEKLGEPLNFGNGINSLKIENNNTKFEIPVSGPKGAGTVYVESTKQGDSWKITKMQLKQNDSTITDLDVNAANEAGKDPTNVEIPLPGLEDEMPDEKK